RQTLVDLSRSGTGILLVSEELDELFEICDRLLVICQGRVSRSLARKETDREEIGLLMTGSESPRNGGASLALQD
ncbi:ABC transporter ATP-binding protein, partial [Rhizobiaceae sp. 2RAB30]